MKVNKLYIPTEGGGIMTAAFPVTYLGVDATRTKGVFKDANGVLYYETNFKGAEVTPYNKDRLISRLVDIGEYEAAHRLSNV